MAKENEQRKRDHISFNVTADVRRSAASCRFIEEYRATSEHAEKRMMIVNALRSGQMLEEAGLGPVMAFLDTEGFENLNKKERQLLIIARLQDYLGISPQVSPDVVPRVQPPAEEEPTPANGNPQQDMSQTEPAGKTPPEQPAPVNPRVGGFASKLRSNP
ncbi:hypothetical protein [Enterobacter soli]|uniref:hypothetical protein n=1 Tax=Enterobacter soli TaxID=885040 RepID=UPI002F3F8ADF